MKAKEFFEQHDHSKLTTAQEDGSYLILKYVFELMEEYAKDNQQDQYEKVLKKLIEEIIVDVSKSKASLFEKQNITGSLHKVIKDLPTKPTEEKKNRLPGETHRERHIKLHQAFDELFADYIDNHPDEIEFTKMKLNKLLDWSHDQTKKPNHPR